jgi:hypothetical protein
MHRSGSFVLVLFLIGGSASAQAQRTFVSSSGSDANPYSAGATDVSAALVSYTTFGLFASSGVLESYGNNEVRANGTDLTGVTTVAFI